MDARITVADLKKAESAILSYVQRSSFPQELEALRTSGSVKTASPLATPDPLLRGGIIIVGGRLTCAAAPEEQKHPAILPKKHPVVDLLIKQTHEDAGHSGREHVLAELRARFWIINGNATVRRVLRGCLSCRRRQGPLMEQKMADLPADRLTPNQPPFICTGVDFLGPFFVKRGRGQEKRY